MVGAPGIRGNQKGGQGNMREVNIKGNTNMGTLNLSIIHFLPRLSKKLPNFCLIEEPICGGEKAEGERGEVCGGDIGERG